MKQTTKAYLVIAGTGHCLVCGEDCRGSSATPEDIAEIALCMCASCGESIQDDMPLLAAVPESRAMIDKAQGRQEIYPGLWATFDKPGIYDADGLLISREVELAASPKGN